MYKTLVVSFVVFASLVWADSQPNYYLEQYGESINNIRVFSNEHLSVNPRASANRLGNVLLIPDWTTDSVYMFDPYDATPLGGLCKVPGSGSPKNAVQGPDNNIYVSDQIQDAVFMFDSLGTYLGIYADASDGLDNVRGIAFRGDHLFICSHNTTTALRSVKEFSGPHTYVRDFIANYTGIDAFDILFLADGRALFADAGTSDKIALHDTNGVYISTVYGHAGLWPQQIQADSVLPGAFLACLWDADTIIDFDLDGTIVHSCTLKYVKGAYRLGNGNILATNNYGMWEFNTTTGAVNRLNTNTGWQYIELYSASATGVSENNNSSLGMIKVYPNPAKRFSTIQYSVPIAGNVSIKLYGANGSLVKIIHNGYINTGNYTTRLSNISSGVYFLKYTDGTTSREIKLAVE